MKDFGKKVQWPTLNTKSLKQTDDYMKKIYKRWRCYMVYCMHDILYVNIKK